MSFLSSWFSGGTQQQPLTNASSANSSASTSSYSSMPQEMPVPATQHLGIGSGTTQGSSSAAPPTSSLASYLASFSFGSAAPSQQLHQQSADSSPAPPPPPTTLASFLSSSSSASDSAMSHSYYGDIHSKRDEQEIILDVISHLKDQINATDLENTQLKEYLIQMIYCEMFGYSTEFGYLAAINLASSDQFHSKRIGYLFVTNFISLEHELSVMMIGTLQKDLQSTNYLVVDLALRATSRLLTSTSLPALEPQIRKLFSHHKPIIRKKALLSLMQCYEIRREQLESDEARKLKLRRRSNSGASGSLTSTSASNSTATTASDANIFTQRLRENDASILELCHDGLADSDVQVMNASIIGLYQLVSRAAFFAQNKERVIEFVPSLVSILSQISENRLDKSYLYHRIPAPWIQIRVMKILSIIGRKNKEVSLQTYEVLREVARRSDNGNQTGNSVLYEAIRCMSLIYPNKLILNYAAEYAETMLSSSSIEPSKTSSSKPPSALDNQNAANLRYVGLQTLCDLVQAKPEFASKFQHYIVDSLESKDEALLRKALDLLFSMTNHNNASIIVKRMISILATTFDVHFADELTRKIFLLSHKYAPDEKWFLEVADEVMKMKHAPVRRDHIELVLKVIGGLQVVGATHGASVESESDEDTFHATLSEPRDAIHLQVFSVDKYFDESLSASEYQMPLVFLEVIIFTLGAYGHRSSKYSLEEILLRLCDLAERRYEDDSSMLQLIVYAMMKLIAKSSDPAKHLNDPQLSDLLMRFRNSSNVDLQQRCYEFLRLKQISPESFSSVAPDQRSHVNNSAHIDVDLTFLDGYVESLGGEQYDEKILEAIANDEKKSQEQLKIDTTPGQRLRGYLPNITANSPLSMSDVSEFSVTGLNSSNHDDEDELILKPARSTWGENDEEDGEDDQQEHDATPQHTETPHAETSAKSDSQPNAQMKDLLARNFRADPLTDTFHYGEEEHEQEESKDIDPKKREKAQEKWGSLFVGLDLNDNEPAAGVQRRGSQARKTKRMASSASTHGKKKSDSSQGNKQMENNRSASNLWNDDFEEDSSPRELANSPRASIAPQRTSPAAMTTPRKNSSSSTSNQQLMDLSALISSSQPQSAQEQVSSTSTTKQQPNSPLDDFLDFDTSVSTMTSTHSPLIASPPPVPQDTSRESSSSRESILTPKQANYNPNAFSQRVQREMANYPPQPQVPEVCAEDNEMSVRYIKAWKPKSLEIVFFLRNKSQKLSHIQFLAQAPDGIFVALKGDPQLVHSVHGTTANVQHLRNPQHEVTVRASLTLKDTSFDSSFVGTIQYQTKANPGIFQSVMFDISFDLVDILRPDTSTLTAQFAQEWPKLDFERQTKIQDITIDSVKAYVEKMKGMQLHIVDLKDNEIIAATRVLDVDEKCLVHAKVSGTTIQFSCKCDTKNIADALILHAERSSKKIVL
eukprot:CAMPEP_0117443314 /NCGR_PEP_ID=MMETSP0759-20121206/4628_1 /TAXON_ID=63605 /ORGANISM="Percolomonas cosmopolitus, Strain WS" /LENGTH=1435 /DNA_ID=CAMNT_0005235279 /DNA_START=239 /DNA_END=4546 /DNA_ORIENTATION=+